MVSVVATTRLLSTAYHAEGRAIPSRECLLVLSWAVYKVELPEKHRFPMQKYAMTREAVQKVVAGTNLVSFTQSPLATIHDVQTTHDSNYIKRFLYNDMDPVSRHGWTPV